MPTSLSPAQRLKLDILECGIEITQRARQQVTGHGSRRLVERDYVTTGGLTLVLDGGIFVNAPIGDWFCDHPVATLDLRPDGTFELQTADGAFQAEPLPLPDYLFRAGGPPQAVMTHADRARISPITGCSSKCLFCDWPLLDYQPVSKDVLLGSLRAALDDRGLPPRHVLVSGGTPRPGDEPWLEDVYLSTVAACPIPVDVMLMPRQDRAVIDRLVGGGVCGFALNLELCDREIAARLCPMKHRVGLDGYAETLRHAVELTGGSGRVRSLLLVGLESAESTLRGVELIASVGADPVLSPFRPAPGTALDKKRPPSADLMADLYLAAYEIAERHGVKLGPRCIPCMHNTVTFPDSTGAYRYS